MGEHVEMAAMYGNQRRFRQKTVHVPHMPCTDGKPGHDAAPGQAQGEAEGRSPQAAAMKGAPGAERCGKGEYRRARRNPRRGKRGREA